MDTRTFRKRIEPFVQKPIHRKVRCILVKLGVFIVLFGQQPFEEALDTAKKAGCTAVEIGTGAFPGTSHVNALTVLHDEAAIRRIRDAVTSRGLTISALSCHGNPLHPDKTTAKTHHDDFVATVQLAEKLGVETVITFSGCPGNPKIPNTLHG